MVISVSSVSTIRISPICISPIRISLLVITILYLPQRSVYASVSVFLRVQIRFCLINSCLPCPYLSLHPYQFSGRTNHFCLSDPYVSHPYQFSGESQSVSVSAQGNASQMDNIFSLKCRCRWSRFRLGSCTGIDWSGDSMFQLQVEHGHESNHFTLSSEEQSVCRSQSPLRDDFLPDSLIIPDILKSCLASKSDAMQAQVSSFSRPPAVSHPLTQT